MNNTLLQERPSWKKELERRLSIYRQEKLFRRSMAGQERRSDSSTRAA